MTFLWSEFPPWLLVHASQALFLFTCSGLVVLGACVVKRRLALDPVSEDVGDLALPPPGRLASRSSRRRIRPALPLNPK